MSRLVVMRDPFSGGRTHHEIKNGARLSDELRRLFPEGFAGRWYLYKSEALAENEIDWKKHEATVVEEGTYLLIVRPSGGIDMAYLAYSFLVSLAIGALTYLLTPKPRTPPSSSSEETQSGNNQLAGQTNLLRPGARVPDLLGRVRSYPDLVSQVVESWSKRTQQLQQFFVLGVGDYDLQNASLGETPLAAIGGATLQQYPPGSVVPSIRVLKTSVEVADMSLMVEEGTAVTPTGVVFTASANTISLPSQLPTVIVGDMIAVRNSASNDGFYIFTAMASSGPPWVYTVDGPLANESGSTPVLSLFNYPYVVNKFTTASDANVFANDASGHSGATPGGTGAANGWALRLGPPSGTSQPRGCMRNLTTVRNSGPNITSFNIEKANGDYWLFPSGGIDYGLINLTIWHPVGEGMESGTGVSTITPAASNWYRVPLDDFDEIWVDISFPQGLVQYNSGGRAARAVQVRVEFRRPGATDPQAYVDENFSDDTTGAERFTKVYTVDALATLGLPDGDGCEVRVTRLTVITADTSTTQYIDETHWTRLAALKYLPAQIYDDVTLLQLSLTNTRAAVSLGETSFNCIATRILPTWTGSAWSAPAPTEKWADNLVRRMKAIDGANKPDSDIDLSGIYALQAALDAQDGGDQGKISLTLDQSSDVDSELQTIASLVRAQVYRIGKKLFVTRDQGGKTALALFTGRSKSAEGEQVQLAMKNDSEPDAVIVQWVDRLSGWKVREYQYPELVVPINPLRITPPSATWAQAWRRAQYEWNRITYRRDTLTLQATDEARLLHIGDVVNITDDVANLAQLAGEVIHVAGHALTLDRAADLSAGGFTILLRGQDGRTLDSMAVTQGASATEVILARDAAFAIKGRDDGLGTVYAIYQSASAVVRPWLVTNLEPQPNYTRMIASNWRTEVFDGDAASLPPAPLSTRELELDNYGNVIKRSRERDAVDSRGESAALL